MISPQITYYQKARVGWQQTTRQTPSKPAVANRGSANHWWPMRSESWRCWSKPHIQPAVNHNGTCRTPPDGKQQDGVLLLSSCPNPVTLIVRKRTDPTWGGAVAEWLSSKRQTPPSLRDEERSRNWPRLQETGANTKCNGLASETATKLCYKRT